MSKTTKNLKLETKNWLITGGAGFLGYHLTKRLLTHNSVTILDLAPQPADKIYQQTTYIRGDVRHPDDVKRATRNVDVVIHAAAALPLSSPYDIRTTTIDGTRNILEAAFGNLTHPNPLFQKERASPSYFKRGQRGVNGISRVVFISSTAVYGVPEKHPIYETDALVGVGPYGHAKIEAEKLCEQYRRGDPPGRPPLCIPVVRPKTFIGTERLGVFQILCNWVREGRRIPIIGSGRNRYQLLDVEDLVSAILLLANSKLINQTFNVGAENFSTVLADVGALCDFAKSGAKPQPTPSWLVKPALRALEAVNLSPLYRWVYDTADKDSYVSIDKLKKLGWQPKYSNSQALIRMYKWYLKHYRQFENQHGGITHRVGWDQKALGLFKRFL